MTRETQAMSLPQVVAETRGGDRLRPVATTYCKVRHDRAVLPKRLFRAGKLGK